MKDFLRAAVSSLVQLALQLAGRFLWLLFQTIQLLGLVYLGFSRVYSPIAAAPGARDGAGLLFVGLGVLAGAGIVAAMLAVVEAGVVRRFFPDWEPPDFPG